MAVNGSCSVGSGLAGDRGGRSVRRRRCGPSRNRVVACSAAARLDGVRRGQRRRDAQSRCPDLQVYPHDPARDARAFEPVAGCVENLVPGIEIVRPGLLVVAARGGAARYYDGELALLAKVARAVADATGSRRPTRYCGRHLCGNQSCLCSHVVPVGEVAGFLATLPVRVLDRPALTDLLVRFGVRTLGDYAALSRVDVLTRFGPDAAYVHDLARGVEDRPPVPGSRPWISRSR